MTDAYSILGIPARPWVDTDAVKSAFREHSARAHPDGLKGCGEDFESLRSARSVLLDSSSALFQLASRLGEAQPLPSQPPVEAFDRFSRVGAAVAACRRALADFKDSRSLIGRMAAQGQVLSALREAREAREAVKDWLAGLYEERRLLDARWPQVEVSELRGLALQYRYADRWSKELGDWIFELESAIGK